MVHDNIPSSSWIASSDGFTLKLPFPFFVRLVDFVTARGPLPPANFGRPTPSLYCVCLDFFTDEACEATVAIEPTDDWEEGAVARGCGGTDPP